MQAYDLIMLIVIGMATIFGAIKGFAWQVASLASIIVSYIVAYRFRFDVAAMIQAKPPWNQFLAMLILAITGITLFATAMVHAHQEPGFFAGTLLTILVEK